MLAILTSTLAGAHGKLPMAFEPNQGQAGSPVQFVAHGNGYMLSLMAGKMELASRGSRIAATLVGARLVVVNPKRRCPAW